MIMMYFLNTSVVSTMSEMVSLPSGYEGICILLIAMLTTIFFSCFSALNGLPASDSYELIFSLLGASVAVYGVKQICFEKVSLVIFGLFFSILGTIVIAKIINCFWGRNLL